MKPRLMCQSSLHRVAAKLTSLKAVFTKEELARGVKQVWLISRNSKRVKGRAMICLESLDKRTAREGMPMMIFCPINKISNWQLMVNYCQLIRHCRRRTWVRMILIHRCKVKIKPIHMIGSRNQRR